MALFVDLYIVSITDLKLGDDENKMWLAVAIKLISFFIFSMLLPI